MANPRAAGIVNAVFIFVTFLSTVPAIITPSRAWLKISGYLVTVCAAFSLILGLYLWILTLTVKKDFAPIWIAQTPEIQSLMQTAVRLPFMSQTPAGARISSWHTNKAAYFFHSSTAAAT